jgi:hypothetical protein
MHAPAVVVTRPVTIVHSCAVLPAPAADIAAQVETIALPARQIAEAR